MVANLQTKRMFDDEEELAYSYSYKPRHLDEKEALTRYQRIKATEPNALIELEDLECGHWEVNVYRTSREKNVYLQRRAISLIERVLERIKAPMGR